MRTAKVGPDLRLVVREIIVSGIYQRFANISPRTLLKFSSMLLLVLSLTTVTHFYMVFQNTYICRLQRVQNTAARIVTLTRKYDSITPIMFKLHWLPLHSRIIFKLLLIVYEALNGKALSYISSLLSHRTCSRSLRSSGQELLTVPRAFSIAAPRQWNNLPLSIRKSPSMAIFKRNLKTYLFKESYDF